MQIREFVINEVRWIALNNLVLNEMKVNTSRDFGVSCEILCRKDFPRDQVTLAMWERCYIIPYPSIYLLFKFEPDWLEND